MRTSYLFLCLAILLFQSCMEKSVNYKSYDDYPVYKNTNLWNVYTPESSRFTLWSPTASAVRLKLYDNGTNGDPIRVASLREGLPGVWQLIIKEDLKNTYYTYQVKIADKWLDETPGIYAQAVGVNGMRAMVVDLAETNPANWSDDKGPELLTPNKAILYELHVRDLSTHPSSGSSYPGKLLGLVEQGTATQNGLSTGIDHIKELGATHVHLLPAFDNYSIDESDLDRPQFNWGYDPQNYNVPEGSFASNPFDAAVRIKEFKQMVKGFHDNGIGVILDVVYNHTGRTEESNFNLEVPGYYYRFNSDSTYSNASGCGNETASERTMMRKYIVESVLYWAKEYHIDGFRFDLMGIHDMVTMNEVAAELKAINPSLFVYGEGWTGGGSPLPESKRAVKKNTYLMENITAFSDDVRDGLKGSVFDEKSTGFVSGAANLEESVKFGVVGSIHHPQIDFPAVNYSDTIWANQPWQAVSYVSCHDNHTLFDKLTISRPNATEQEIKAMHCLANAVVLTSQGVPFLHAGVEMMRTKGGEHNSYNLPDAVNQINWQWKEDHQDVYNYYKSLIQLRKNHPAFSLANATLVREHLNFHETQPGLVGFTLRNNAGNDSWKEITVWYNANTKAQTVKLPGNWTVVASGLTIDESGIKEVKDQLTIEPISMFIAYQQ